jgi:hypothetical protein
VTVNFWEQTPEMLPPPAPGGARHDHDPAMPNGFDDPAFWASQVASLDHQVKLVPDATIPAPEDIVRGPSLWIVTEPWDQKAIPRRPWIARGYLMRGAVTVVSGPGSAGKSSLMVAWASAACLGCAFKNFKVPGVQRIATYNVEDDQDEQKRRFSAMFRRLSLELEAFGDRLAIIGPNQIGTLLTLGRDGRLLLCTPAMDELEAFVKRFRPDVLILDPFVELHDADENDNTSVRAVMAWLRVLAVKYAMAVVVLHHARKGIGDPGDPDTLRGASSIVGAARVVLTLNVMTEDEAKAFNIQPARRRNYFRLDGAKSNYAPIEEAEWFERQEVRLENGTDDEPGDGVAVVWPWKAPSIWAETTSIGLNQTLDQIARGPSPGVLYTPTRQGGGSNWAGHVLIEMLAITDEQAKRMIAMWLDTGLLTKRRYEHPEWRRDVTGVEVDDSKRPTE